MVLASSPDSAGRADRLTDSWLRGEAGGRKTQTQADADADTGTDTHTDTQTQEARR
jgi:hypothetical protein